MDLAETVQTSGPTATFGFELEPGDGLTITHTHGGSVPVDSLYLRGEDPDNVVSFGAWPGGGRVTAGDHVKLGNADGDESIRVVWNDGSQSAVLGEWTGPKHGTGGSGGSGYEDPGHAYIDVDDSGTFDTGTDTKLQTADLEDGVTADDGRLIIPSSVGSITSEDGATYEANGIVFATEIVVTNSGAVNGATFDAKAGDLLLDGATIDSRRDQGEVRLETQGQIRASASSITGNGAIDVVADEGVDLSDATVTSTKRGVSISIDATGGGNIDLSQATLDSNSGNPGPGNTLSASVASGQTVTVTGAAFRSYNDILDVSPNGASEGTPAEGSVD